MVHIELSQAGQMRGVRGVLAALGRVAAAVGAAACALVILFASTPAAAQGAGSPVGQWHGDYSWTSGAGGTLDVDVRPGGRLQAGDFPAWTWTQNGNRVQFVEPTGEIWTGMLSGDVLAGTMRRADGTATGTFRFNRGGGRQAGASGGLTGAWEVTIHFPSTGDSTFVQEFTADGLWSEDGAPAGEWRQEGGEYVWTWGEFGSGRMNFRAAINGNRGSGETNSGYRFDMVRMGGGGQQAQGGASIIGAWRDADGYTLTFSADGTVRSSGSNVPGPWSQSGNTVTFTWGSQVCHYTGVISGNRLSADAGADCPSYDMTRVGGGGGGQQAQGGQSIVGAWQDSDGYTLTFSGDGTVRSSGSNVPGPWSQNGNTVTFTWGSQVCHYVGTISADGRRLFADAGADCPSYDMTRVGGGGGGGLVDPAVPQGGGLPVGAWEGQIVWFGANTIDLTWTFNSDGTMYSGFGENGTWTRLGGGRFRGSYRGNGGQDLITFEGTFSRNRMEGTIHSDFQGGFDGTFSFRR